MLHEHSRPSSLIRVIVSELNHSGLSMLSIVKLIDWSVVAELLTVNAQSVITNGELATSSEMAGKLAAAPTVSSIPMMSIERFRNPPCVAEKVARATLHAP